MKNNVKPKKDGDDGKKRRTTSNKEPSENPQTEVGVEATPEATIQSPARLNRQSPQLQNNDHHDNNVENGYTGQVGSQIGYTGLNGSYDGNVGNLGYDRMGSGSGNSEYLDGAPYISPYAASTYPEL